MGGANDVLGKRRSCRMLSFLPLFEVVQGDNMAENLVAGIKNKLRRTQLKGRSGKNKVKVDSLFGAFLLRSSGLHAVLAAVAQYRQRGCSCGVAPAQFFQEHTLPLWLRQAK